MNISQNAGAATGTDKYIYFIFLQGKHFKRTVQFLAHPVHMYIKYLTLHSFTSM